jgi:hypothetical protein
VEWWIPASGQKVESESMKSLDGVLNISGPKAEEDIALKISRE